MRLLQSLYEHSCLFDSFSLFRNIWMYAVSCHITGLSLYSCLAPESTVFLAVHLICAQHSRRRGALPPTWCAPCRSSPFNLHSHLTPRWASKHPVHFSSALQAIVPLTPRAPSPVLPIDHYPFYFVRGLWVGDPGFSHHQSASISRCFFPPALYREPVFAKKFCFCLFPIQYTSFPQVPNVPSASERISSLHSA